MRCGVHWTVKERAMRRWHKWYAWYPVRVNKGSKGCRWLEYVQRKVIYDYKFASLSPYHGIKVIRYYKDLD